MFNLEEEKEIQFTGGMYLVNRYGEILDRNGNLLKVEIKDGIYTVTLMLEAVDVNIAVATLVAITYLNIKIPPSLWGRINPIHIDGKNDNVNPSNITYSFNNGPLAVPGLTGFYYIPFHTGYGINESGDLLNLATGYVKQWSLTKPQVKKNITGGYYFTTSRRDIGSSKIIFRHRSLCLAFKGYNVDPKTLIVNHKNGIPGSDALDNLEWTTYAKNNQHAYDNGLRPNGTRPILFKRLDTGEIRSFISISECCRFIERHHSFVEHRLRRGSGKRYFDGFVFKYDDGVDWPELTTDVTFVTNEAKEIIARDIFTGKLSIFDSSLAAGNATGVSSTSVGDHAKGELIVPLNGYNFRYLSSNIRWPNHSARHLEIYRKYPLKPPCGILSKNIFTGEEVFFRSPKEASEQLGVSRGQICDRCRTGNIYDKAYTFSFYKLNENLGPVIE